jgi:hypothetical protein
VFNLRILLCSHNLIVLKILFVEKSPLLEQLESMGVNIQHVDTGLDVLDYDIMLLMTGIGLGNFFYTVVNIIWCTS